MQSEWYFYAYGVVLLCSRSGTFMQSEWYFSAQALQSLHSSYSHKKRDAISNYISSNTIEYTIVSLGLVIILPSITLVSTCHSFLILIKPCFSEKSPSFMHSHSKLTMDYNADRRTMVDVLKHLKSRYVAL